MARCPACSAENPDGKRFCADCGSSLTAQCPGCGAAVPPGKRFCGDCGHQLAPVPVEAPAAGPTAAGRAAAAAPVAAAAQRRVCSVLFADLVGFTPFSESRDAEAVRELLSGYFDVARTVVARYGGVVEKFIGDAVMAVWGVPNAHEDDAERAVRAGLELVDAVTAYGERGHATGLRARAGVVTAEVAVTVGAAGQGMVAGDAVNTASRVQAVAEPGTVYVDETTRQATSRAISYADAGAHELKGKSGSMRLFRAAQVVGAVGGAERVDGLEARFLGRDAEFRTLKEAFHATVERRAARLVSVAGSAGVGKSRLRWEFFKYIDGLADQVLWHAGRCLAYGEGVAYWALAEMVRSRLGIAEDEPIDSAAGKLDEGLHRWIDNESDRAFLAPRLGALLGTSDPGLGREELVAGWRLWFERLAEHLPVVLVVEDLQWADDGLWDFLEHLLDWSADHPMFLVTFSRPEITDRRPTWAAGRRNATSLPLEPLPAPVMAQLLADLVPGMPDEVSARIVEQADGIPLYAVELVRSLIDRDVVQPVDGVYRLVRQVDELNIPAGLSSLVSARIDTLPEEERTLVQGLAVLGSTFPRAAVAAVCELPTSRVDELLANLVRQEILTVRTDRFAPDRGHYAFTQNLLRQVAYDTLSRHDRKVRHLEVAKHLRATFPDDGAEAAEVVAGHYLDAYQAVPEAADADRIRDEAVAAYARAGGRAATVGAPLTAQRAFLTAAELAGEPGQRAELTFQAAEWAAEAGRNSDAAALFESAAGAFRSAGRPREAAYADGQCGRWSEIGERSISRLRGALDLLAGGEPDALLARTHLSLGRRLLFAGRSADAPPHFDAALELAQALRLPDVLAEAADGKAMLLGLRNRSEEALAYSEWAIRLAERYGLPQVLARAHLVAGDLCLTGDLPGAREHSLTAMELHHRRGSRSSEATATANLVLVDLLGGRWVAAEGRCREMVTVLDVADAPLAVQLHQRLAMLLAWRGELASAQAELGELGSWQDTADEQARWFHRATVATVSLAGDDPLTALRLGTEAVERAVRTLGFSHEVVRQAWPDAVEAALRCDRLAEADQLLALLADSPPGHVPPYLRAQLERYQARLAAARGQTAGVAEGFAAAVRSLRQLDYPYWLALTLLDQARWLLDTDGAAAAGPLLREAADICSQLGATPVLEACTALLGQPEPVAQPQPTGS